MHAPRQMINKQMNGKRSPELITWNFNESRRSRSRPKWLRVTCVRALAATFAYATQQSKCMSAANPRRRTPTHRIANEKRFRTSNPSSPISYHSLLDLLLLRRSVAFFFFLFLSPVLCCLPEAAFPRYECLIRFARIDFSLILSANEAFGTQAYCSGYMWNASTCRNILKREKARRRGSDWLLLVRLFKPKLRDSSSALPSSSRLLPSSAHLRNIIHQ